MISDYLRKVVDRLSHEPIPVQDQFAARLEVDLDELKHNAPEVPVTEDEERDEAEAVYDPSTDPLAQFIGAVHSGTPDLARRHDAYLAEAYANDHNDDSK